MTDLASRAQTPPTGGQVCTLFAVDIAGFTRTDRDDDIRLYLHEELYRILAQAFDTSGIPWTDCFDEDRGDGALVVIPPSFGARAVLHPLLERLRTLIRRHNHVSRDAAGLQLRAAIHVGPVEHDGHGFIGTDVNFLFRMLDARPLRAALDQPGVELACIISEDLYRNVVCRHPILISFEDFKPVSFQVKRTRARARIYRPGLRHTLRAGGLFGRTEECGHQLPLFLFMGGLTCS
jgi:class 3 adenylate cyclase